MSDDAPKEEPSAFASNAKLVAKSAARAFGVLVAYVSLGIAFHWAMFWYAAGDIWSTLHAGPGPAHAAAAAVIWLVVMMFTPQGLITVIYLVGMPALCFLLGQKQAIRAALHGLLRDRKNELLNLVTGMSMRAVSAASSVPGAERAGSVARRVRDSIDSMEGSRASRFLLRAVLRGIRLPDVIATSDFLARSKADPAGAESELRILLEPRVMALGGQASFRPLLVVFAFTALVTFTCPWWTGWL